MSSFGYVVNTPYIKGLPEFTDKPKITRKDRSDVAFKLKDQRYKGALEMVNNWKAEYGNGVSALCLIYNATGDKLSLVDSYDWHGHIWKIPYTPEIENGQYGAFLHVHSTGAAAGSEAAVVYRGTNDNDDIRDWLVSWCVPWWFGNNSTYTSIAEENYFHNKWGEQQHYLEESGHNSKMIRGGCHSNSGIGEYTSPVMEAVFTLEHVTH